MRCLLLLACFSLALGCSQAKDPSVASGSTRPSPDLATLRTVQSGMTKNQVRALCGEPADIRREQFYFKDGYLPFQRWSYYPPTPPPYVFSILFDDHGKVFSTTNDHPEELPVFTETAAPNH